MVTPHELVPQPSADRAAWHDALQAGDTGRLVALAEHDAPGASLLEIETFINGLYRGVAMSGAPSGATDAAFRRVAAAHSVAQALRRSLGWQVRHFDLELLRMIRRSSALSAVLGAGVSMGAGGPSWAKLVRRLLETTLERGIEFRAPVSRSTHTREDGTEELSVTYGVVETRRYDDAQRRQAESVLEAVRRDGSATDVEALMQGAQLCLDLCGQELFRLLTTELYGPMKAPSATHRAIAALAHAQPVPSRGPGAWPGWDTIVTYNFDSLMSEALAESRVPHAAYAARKGGMGIDPDPLARDGDWHVPVLHLHGYTPRRLFRITDTHFVFSTSQYAQAYGGERLPMLDQVVDRVLANPVHVALYIGCSFADEAMNGLLARAFARWPGRYHYAFLQWPHARLDAEPSPEAVQAEAERYLAFGVRPVWFDDFAELPAMVEALA
ncbi:MAG: SIR2 family protein [Piscinibacter sp.]